MLVPAPMLLKVLIYMCLVCQKVWHNRIWKVYLISLAKLLHHGSCVTILQVNVYFVFTFFGDRTVWQYPCLGLSKGVGFIRFDQRAEAERAIQSLNGTTPKGAVEPITVKFANNPSSNLNKALPPLAAYLTPQSNRRFAGPIHHPTGRFRYKIALQN